MGYFHGQGYYYLDGDDFIDVFRLRNEPDPSVLAPYVEFVKMRQVNGEADDVIVKKSIELMRHQFELLPETNPFEKFKPHFVCDLEWLKQQDLETFHQYSFATLRQFGACYELAANYLNWLSSQGEKDLEQVIKNIKSISEAAKVYQFQLARTVSRKKELDLSPIDNMAQYWDAAMSKLKQLYT